MPLIPGAKVSVGVPPPSSSPNLNADDWTSFQFRFLGFAFLDSTKGYWLESPVFDCSGRQWLLMVYPGGDFDASDEDKISIYLRRDMGLGVEEGDKVINYQISIIDELGENRKSSKFSFYPKMFSSGWSNFISRSDILNNGFIGSDGALTIVVSIEGEQSAIFVPPNSAAKKMDAMFNDEATADVCFEVASTNTCHTKGGYQKSSNFHAHRNILSKFAPMLAGLVATSDKFSITDVKPDVFRHLLYYVYGGEVPSEELKKHAKEIIDAANKYAIINLKLTAEAAYVESTDITIDNAIDNLLYADGMNCALLKEKVMNFFVDQPTASEEIVENISFADCPFLSKDILAAVGRNYKNESSGNEDELSTLSVSALRMKLHEKGLNIDGSREAMIKSLKNSTIATSGEQSEH